MQQAHRRAGQQGDGQRERQADRPGLKRGIDLRAAQQDIRHKTGEGRHQHHALDPDVDDAGTLVEQPAQRAKRDRDGETDRGVYGGDNRQAEFNFAHRSSSLPLLRVAPNNRLAAQRAQTVQAADDLVGGDEHQDQRLDHLDQFLGDVGSA